MADANNTPFEQYTDQDIKLSSDLIEYDFIQDTLDRKKKAEQYQIEKENRPKYVKFNGPGNYQFRVIFAGNMEKNIPFYMYQRHSYFDINKKTAFKYVDSACWHWLVKDTNLMKYLAERKRISRQDLDQYSQGGCPGCNVYKVLADAGVGKDPETGKSNGKLGKIKLETRYLYNVYLLGKDTPGGLDKTNEGFYVWECGQSNHEAIIQGWMDAKKQQNKDLMDLATGHNLSIVVKGSNISTRYYPSWVPFSSPFTRELKVIDFKQLMVVKARPFQEMCNHFKLEWGENYLDKMNYKIPGDLGTPFTGKVQNNNIADDIFPVGEDDSDPIPF